MFESLGWMILAKEHKRTAKLRAYMEGINHLEETLIWKIGETRDPDRKDDLGYLLKNTKILKRHASKLIKKNRK
jgi:hypothetical protein